MIAKAHLHLQLLIFKYKEKRAKQFQPVPLLFFTILKFCHAKFQHQSRLFVRRTHHRGSISESFRTNNKTCTLIGLVSLPVMDAVRSDENLSILTETLGSKGEVTASPFSTYNVRLFLWSKWILIEFS